MNYYAQGGQAHGIKALAQELPKYGRGGDSIVAHINPQEAEMLKSMGGSGTINPTTGLPEFGFFKSVSNAVAAPFRAANEVVKAVPIIGPAIDRGLVGLDKTVGKTIPGGWGTLGSIAASFIPGVTPMMMAGLGGLTGSGALRKDGKFNLQGALMGGATAYGMANLANADIMAGGGASSIPAGDIAAANASVDPIGALNASQGFTGPVAQEAAANAVVQGAGTSAANAVNPDVYSGLAGTQGAITPPPAPSALENFASGYGRNVEAAGRGIANLSGLAGEEGTAAAARAAFEGSGATLKNTALPIATGGMGLMALKEQEDYLNAQKTAGAIDNSEYNAQMGRINEAKARASTAMEENPYKFAMGGVINPPDDQTNMPNQSPMQNFERGGPAGYAMGGNVSRFLSGGGDGLSDSIPATIEDKQPAKLADGEFVVSSDVVSGLGGGSSKAGAKKLYAMMDRVRKQAHGTKKQIRPVSKKALPA